MIEYRKIKGRDNAYELFVNDELYENVEVNDAFYTDRFEIASEDIGQARKLMDFRLLDFPDLSGIILRLSRMGLFKVTLIAELFGEEDEEEEGLYLIPQGVKMTYNFEVSLIEWKGNYTFVDYEVEFGRLSKESNEFDFNLQPLIQIDDVAEFDIKCYVDIDEFKNKTISDTISPLVVHFNEINKQVIDNLNERISATSDQKTQNLLTAIFDFPNSIKIPAEQYLYYFVQFLRDIGINATSSLREEAGKVLFSITPDGHSDGLDKIREALSIYLNLPSNPVVYNDSFAAMRLQQQIENLQHSQKMAARELQLTEKLLVAQSDVIHEKNTIISQKDSTIDQQNRIIEKITSKLIMIDSLENKEEFETLFDGLKVGESKWLKDNLGIKVNLVKSLKSLGGKLLRKDEGIVTLDLVEREAENDANN